MSPRRMPTKGELLRLQKLYRTDKKIAEVLGVEEHLVSYWRRKKGVAQYSFPKFSEKDIREVWDRFGDDFHAGMELGISKAAFYNWRRKYKIIRKPEALKLEQLSLQLFTADRRDRRRIGTGRQTIMQKCLSQKTGKKEIQPGDEVEFEPDLIMSTGGTYQALNHFQNSGIKFVKHPNHLIISIGTSESEVNQLKSIRDFARLQQIQNFMDIGEGNGVQLAMEQGLILPGHIIVGSSRSDGGIGCLGATGFYTDSGSMADLWASGLIKYTIPKTTRIVIAGRSPRGVFTRDVVHQVIADIHNGEIENHQIEIYGGAIDQMSISERFALCRVLMAAGAAGAVCPYDATTRRYLNPRARRPYTPILADRNAVYSNEYTFDVNTMQPVAAGPDSVLKVSSVDELRGIPIQQVFIGGALNGRFDDLRITAEILKGQKVNPETRLTIQPASRQIYLDALKKGLIRLFVEAGAIVNPPDMWCGDSVIPDVAKGENGLTTHHQLAAGVGSGNLYQVSPATAAASAITGQITNPAGYVKI